MKKGQTIKLRITDIRKDDVILYSNIKKQQVILPFSEIKTNQKNTLNAYFFCVFYLILIFIKIH